MTIQLHSSVCYHILNLQTGLKVVDGIKVCAIPNEVCICFLGRELIADFPDFILLVYLLTVDDARLLLGIYYHGFGNWEKIRLDERLGLMKKIAPVELQHHETFLPRAPNLKDRASALLEQVRNNMKSTFFIIFLCFIYMFLLHAQGGV